MSAWILRTHRDSEAPAKFCRKMVKEAPIQARSQLRVECILKWFNRCDQKFPPYDLFWPGSFLLACSSPCLVGIHFSGSVDLDQSEVCEDWWTKYLADTAGVRVGSE